MSDRRRVTWIVVGVLAGVVLVAAAVRLIPDMVATQKAVRVYTALLSASFEADLGRVRALCSQRYLNTHPLNLSKEGGVVGLPRGINKNFQVWREGDHVLLCPTNRVGPLYRFVREGDAWKFDGAVGLLRSGGRIDRFSEDGSGMTEEEAVAL